MLTMSHRKQLRDGNVAPIKRTRDSTRGQYPETATPGSRDFSTGPLDANLDWEDNLRPSRGIVFGCIGGLALWALFIWMVFPK